MLVLSALAAMMTACGLAGNREQASASEYEEMTLKIYLFGEYPDGLDAVVEEMEKRLKDSLNLRFDFEFDNAVTYEKAIKMRLAKGEQFDLVFDAGWMTNNEIVSNEWYYDLEEYFQNDDYPGLKKAFGKELIENNRINGHVYWIPMVGAQTDMKIAIIRKDLREAMGMEPVTSDEQLRAYLDGILADYPDMIPLYLGRKGFYEFFNDDLLQRNRAGIFCPNGTGNMELFWEVAISEDGRTCLGATTYGDPDEKFASYPEAYRHDYYLERFQEFTEWRGYLMEGSDMVALSNDDRTDYFAEGKAAAIWGGLSGFASTREKVKANFPDAELEIYPLYEEQRRMEQEAVYTDWNAGNFCAIPITTTPERKERVMLFLDWLYSSQENHDLLSYGLEGVNYQPEADNEYRVLDNGRYYFPTYELGMAAIYERINASEIDESKEYMEYMKNPATYATSMLAGFAYDDSNVKIELSAINDIYTDIWFQLWHGASDDVEKLLEDYHAAAQEAGLETIREDLIRQVQEFLDGRAE